VRTISCCKAVWSKYRWKVLTSGNSGMKKYDLCKKECTFKWFKVTPGFYTPTCTFLPFLFLQQKTKTAHFSPSNIYLYEYLTSIFVYLPQKCPHQSYTNQSNLALTIKHLYICNAIVTPYPSYISLLYFQLLEMVSTFVQNNQ
jgi:hypothetical protein